MSTFTADEVEFIRGRGNVYCAKVWLGLHDGKLVGNDSESIRDFIIQKYEKKRLVYRNETDDRKENRISIMVKMS